jgi:RNA polymerase sigma factor (sigma-70 family)
MMTVTAQAETPAIRSLLRRPTLTVERERHLLRTCRASLSEKARLQALSELWESHSKLVVAIARQFRHPDLEMTDLVGAGHLGMQAAIEGFDPDRFGTRLSTYAIRWIRHYIRDYISRHAFPKRSLGSPAHRQLIRTTGRLFAEARRSCQREGIAASNDELCARVGARIGLPGDEVAQCLKLARGDALRIDIPDADTRSIQDGLATPIQPPEDATIHRLDHAKLRRRTLVLAEQILGERERMVFLARCMANEGPAAHPESLAARLGVTRDRVHQLEASARRKIAVALAHDGLLDSADRSVDLPKSRAPRRAHGSLLEAPG